MNNIMTILMTVIGIPLIIFKMNYMQAYILLIEMFNLIIQASLEDLTNKQPTSESEWYGTWNAILSHLFPSSNGYIIAPQTAVKSVSDDYTIPDFYVEVLKVSNFPLSRRIVAILKIKNTPRWPGWKERIEEQISKQVDYAFDKSAKDVVYCIMAIGPHWEYGIKHDNGQRVQDLIQWHDVIHDEGSYKDFRCLKELVDAL